MEEQKNLLFQVIAYLLMRRHRKNSSLKNHHVQFNGMLKWRHYNVHYAPYTYRLNYTITLQYRWKTIWLGVTFVCKILWITHLTSFVGIFVCECTSRTRPICKKNPKEVIRWRIEVLPCWKWVLACCIPCHKKVLQCRKS